MAIQDRGLYHWFPYYLYSSLVSNTRYNSKPAHILFCLVDHYEPFNSGADYNLAQKRVSAWVEGYPRMAAGHKDADGRPPQHTWFYPPHLDIMFLDELLELSVEGYGEIEMHLHHNKMEPFPDTADSLRDKIGKCIDDYSERGIFCLPNGENRFGFIHGDWSLDNACGDEICGVNNEIIILRELGCYADFTFPSLGNAQPSMVNRIMYVKDNPLKRKSYNWGRQVKVGGVPWGDLMLIQGIIGFRWVSRRHRLWPSIEASNIGGSDYSFPERIDHWVKNAVRIIGQPNWLFIKLHTHGCNEINMDNNIGSKAHEMYNYLEGHYNDNVNYCLHYVTAREMYNIIKAAEGGRVGNPGLYRDYEIPRYTYLPAL